MTSSRITKNLDPETSVARTDHPDPDTDLHAASLTVLPTAPLHMPPPRRSRRLGSTIYMQISSWLRRGTLLKVVLRLPWKLGPNFTFLTWIMAFPMMILRNCFLKLVT